MRELLLLGERGLRLRAAVPETGRERRRGLLGIATMDPDQAMLLARTRSVHTFGMRFEIAVAVLGTDLRVRDVVRLRPGRLLLPRPGARHVLECARGVDLRPGDRLRPVHAGQPPSPAAPVTTQEPVSSSTARFTPNAASSESADA